MGIRPRLADVAHLVAHRGGTVRNVKTRGCFLFVKGTRFNHMEYDELLANMKSHLWKKIERKMAQASTRKIRNCVGLRDRIRPEDRQAYIEGRVCVLPEAINRSITAIMALGYNRTIDAAVADVVELHSALGGLNQPHEDAVESATQELTLCNEIFGSEVAVFKRMHKLAKSGVSNQEVWDQIIKKEPREILPPR